MVDAIKQDVPATCVVYKSGSTYYAKDGLTGKIVSSNADASIVIQAAVDAAELVAGVVHIMEGTYSCANDIVIGADYVTLKGSGYLSTLLVFASGQDGITVGSGAARFYGITISDILIGYDGAYTDVRKGIWLQSVTNATIRNVYIDGFQTALDIDTTGGYAIYSYYDNLNLINCKFGVYIHGANAHNGGTFNTVFVRGNWPGSTYEAGSIGYYCYIGDTNVLINYSVESIETGFMLDYFDASNMAQYTTIFSPRIEAVKYGIEFANSVWRNRVIGGMLVADTSNVVNIANAPSNDFTDVIGVPTHATSTSTGTGAQQTIAHGLLMTPTAVLLTSNETGCVELSQTAASDATNIYVTATLNKDYRWWASADPY